MTSQWNITKWFPSIHLKVFLFSSKKSPLESVSSNLYVHMLPLCGSAKPCAIHTLKSPWIMRFSPFPWNSYWLHNRQRSQTFYDVFLRLPKAHDSICSPFSRGTEELKVAVKRGRWDMDLKSQELGQKPSPTQKTAAVLMGTQVNDYCTLFIALMYESECFSLVGRSQRLSAT